MAAGLSLGLPRIVVARDDAPKPAPPSETVRIAVIGMGATKAIGGVGGRGHQLIPRIREVPGAKIVALCDVNSTFLEREAKPFKDRGEEITTYSDLRRVFDNKDIDAVVLSVPNHWHALGTVWACQAGKDVYVEKPFCHDIWEGRQMVAAGHKYGRMIQVGTQNRSNPGLRETIESLHAGALGAIRSAHALVYRARDGIGKVTEPTPIPDYVDYDIWCGPSPKGPLMRKQLDYEWHWFWSTGNGEMGNNGVHVIDVCRWALGQNMAPPRAMCIGGRFAFDDCGETANTQVALFDYHPAPMLCEVRNVRSSKRPDALGKFRDLGGSAGVVIDCEGGYFAGELPGGALYDSQGKKMRDIPTEADANHLETLHLANFVSVVRSRNAGDLAAGAAVGHASTACCHLANISYRIGKTAAPEAIADSIKSKPEFSDAFARCRENLRANGVDLGVTEAVLGPGLTFDTRNDRFVAGFAIEANALRRREYRAPFVVPKIA